MATDNFFASSSVISAVIIPTLNLIQAVIDDLMPIST